MFSLQKITELLIKKHSSYFNSDSLCIHFCLSIQTSGFGMPVGVNNIRNNGRKKLLVLGNTGDGKSTLCNILGGFDPSDQSMFPVSGGALSCTQVR